jgi:SNF2 family DNA or RNA helicase
MMVNETFEILGKRIQQYFSHSIAIKALNLLEKKLISISFRKGSSLESFVVSGLVLERPPLNVKVSLRESQFKHSCNCMLWKAETGCEHVAALYADFLLLESQEIGSLLPTEESASNQNLGFVTPKQYGTIIRSPLRLNGGKLNTSYAGLKYQLISQRVVTFPGTEPFTHNLNIRFQSHEGQTFSPLFSIQYPTYEEKNISLFEHHYIFDWNTGKAYEIPDDLRSFIISTKNLPLTLSSEHLFLLLQDLLRNQKINVFFNDIEFKKEELTTATFTLIINPATFSSSYEISLFLSEENQTLSMPDFFKIFIFKNGYLQTFTSRSEAQSYLKSILDENLPQDYKKYLYTTDAKNLISLWSEAVLNQVNLVFFDISTQKFFNFETIKIKDIFRSISQSMGDNSLRHSVLENNEISFTTGARTLESGLPVIYEKFLSYGYKIFYKSKPIKNWQGQVKFERKQSNLNWFELNIDISGDDFNFLKNVEVSNNILFNEDELIILTKSQQDYIRFLKKYMSEGKEDKEAESGDGQKRFNLKLGRSRIFEIFELRKLGFANLLNQEELELCQKLEDLEKLPTYPVPRKTQSIARHYQVDGYQWIRFLFEHRFGGCLADDMGLGKTLQAIMFLESIIGSVNKVLIACPVSILSNWESEIKKFSNLESTLYYGNERKLTGNEKIIITSYGIIKRDFETTFKDVNFDIFIMDEVQHLKNVKSLGATVARSINSQFRLCLTGTPVENDLSEFYNIMDLSLPGIWGDMKFMRSDNKDTRSIAKTTAKPFILRRKKDQVLKELPDKVENTIMLDFSPEEKQKYTQSLIRIRSELEQNKKQYGQVLKNLLELRQLCLWQNQETFMSTKVDFLMEQLEQILQEGYQVLVFSQFTTYLDHIQKQIKEKKWDYSRIDGTQTMKKRTEEVFRFQDSQTKVFLISLKAGGVGLNLTKANYIFLMDPWWNPAVENQAIDRAHRIGQENKVTVYRPIMKDSVEEKVLALQQTKKELFKELLDNNDLDEKSTALTLDTILGLLS